MNANLAVSATNWTGQSNAGGTGPATSGVAMTATVFHKLSIQLNANWTSVSFFADGTQIGSAITTNIPTGVPLSPILYLAKISGATAVGYFIDSFWMDYKYVR